ncbi:hypothetical protein [Cupriavidus basilensis]|uniref:hypothetical protein n=1 Tax=Cupriavidus basilensis TaxID=68895 RepID=UPI00157AA356|nr:hypothetical protein [Cupriavidus basilensis]NUA28250.1 hypothetical protein [Cupriavidus basilensis]
MMSMCEACAQIRPGSTGGTGHPRLLLTDTQRIKPRGQPAITFATYTCADCGCRWRHESDKNGNGPGWSIQPAG